MRWANKLLYDTQLPSKREKTVPAIIGGCSWIVITVFSYLSYLLINAVRRPSDEMPALWLEQIGSKCPGRVLLPNVTAMIDMGEIASFYGCLFGILVSVQCFGGMRSYAKP